MSNDIVIQALTERDVADTATLLALTFDDDPSFAYFFPPEPDEQARQARIRSFCLFMVERTLRAGDMALGIRDSDGRLAAFALAEDSRGFLGGALRRTMADLGLYWSRLRPLGSGVLDRMARYFKASRSPQAKDFSLYLVMIGVAPVARGRGLSRALVDYLRAYDRKRSWARGLGLDTENPANVGLYTRLGLTQRAAVTLDGLRIFVFRDGSGETRIEDI